MKELTPDVVRPIDRRAPKTACVAFGASLEEALWLTASSRAAARSSFPAKAAVYLHSLRFGADVVTRRHEGGQRQHFIQRTKGGGVLLVNARQRGDAPNAWTMNDAGRVLRRLSLGDGLSDVRVSPQGKIWTAYFDEGVFGSGAGAPGLVARDGAGRKVWAHDAQQAGRRLRLPKGTDVKSLHAFGAAHRLVVWTNQHVMIVENW